MLPVCFIAVSVCCIEPYNPVSGQQLSQLCDDVVYEKDKPGAHAHRCNFTQLTAHRVCTLSSRTPEPNSSDFRK